MMAIRVAVALVAVVFAVVPSAAWAAPSNATSSWLR
jgi:hypothetical protein